MLTQSPAALLVIVALILTLIQGLNGKVPLWIPVFLLCLALLAGHLPGLH